MELSINLFKELPDGSAIVELTLDNKAKEYLIGEGFLAILKRSIASSESYVQPEINEEIKNVEL
jgi:hypothetical protein